MVQCADPSWFLCTDYQPNIPSYVPNDPGYWCCPTGTQCLVSPEAGFVCSAVNDGDTPGSTVLSGQAPTQASTATTVPTLASSATAAGGTAASGTAASAKAATVTSAFFFLFFFLRENGRLNLTAGASNPTASSTSVKNSAFKTSRCVENFNMMYLLTAWNKASHRYLLVLGYSLHRLYSPSLIVFFCNSHGRKRS